LHQGPLAILISPVPRERQLTFAPHGHVLTHVNVFSPDSTWIVYDTRSDPAGSLFDGTRIEKVNLRTGEVVVLYESKHGACCGVAAYSPADTKIAFIRGPEHPTGDWSYGPDRREGIIIDEAAPGVILNLDGRDLSPPFTPGALRGGSHVHIFSGDGGWLSFTYDDHVLMRRHEAAGGLADGDVNQRNVGVAAPLRAVAVPRAHRRNHGGTHFCALVTRTVNCPVPGSDEIQRAFEDAWVGTDGYMRRDGTRQRRALAFQGEVITAAGAAIREVFIVDIPDDITRPGAGPLQGTATRRPFPPRGAAQARLTFSADRRYPGIDGPRHWLRSSADGRRIAFLMKDDAGIVQLFTIAPTGGEPAQLTRGQLPIASAFTWSNDGGHIACVIDHSVCIVDAATGEIARLTERGNDDDDAPRPEACAFSPDGKHVAFVRHVTTGGRRWNQVFVAEI
jgi:hypothetical protein